MQNPLENTFTDFCEKGFMEILTVFINDRFKKQSKIIDFNEYFDESEQSTMFKVKFHFFGPDQKRQILHIPLWKIIGYMFTIMY